MYWLIDKEKTNKVKLRHDWSFSFLDAALRIKRGQSTLSPWLLMFCGHFQWVVEADSNRPQGLAPAYT